MQVDAALNLVSLALSGAMAAMLAGMLSWFAAPTRHGHYRVWAAAWAAQAAYFLVGSISFGTAILLDGGVAARITLSALTQAASAVAAVLLVLGTIGFANHRSIAPGTLRAWIAAAVITGIFVAALVQLSDARIARQLFRAFVTTASYLGSGAILWRRHPTLGRPERFLAVSLLGFGASNLHTLVYWLAVAAGQRPAYQLTWFSFLDLLWIAATATTMAALALADQGATAAADMERREREFRQVVEHSTDLIVILDAERIVRYASPSATRLLEPGEELVGRPILDFIHPDDRGLIERRATASTPDSSPFLARVRTRGGNWARFEAVSTRVTRANSSQELVIVNARDVTERERLETTIRETQKLESIGRLAGGIAHDLNNILTVIEGNAELARDADADSVQEHLGEVVGASRRASDLTRQLLTFARRDVVVARVVDVSDAVARTVRMAARLIPESIELRVTPPTGDCHVRIDPGQLEQVVMNLLVNARDAITERGSITVTLGRTMIATPVEPGVVAGEYVTLEVRDTGSGIDDSVRAHLFEPFFTTKAAGEGTGLGLATTYGIVHQAGGFIKVDSALGAGATFSVSLPAVDAEADDASVAPPPSAVGHGEFILLVEDDASVRRLQREVLRRAGFQVLEAANGVEALSLLNSQQHVDVIVSDVVMPRLGGGDLARRARQLRPEIGLLLLSGHPGKGDFLRTLPPRTSFLQKPVTSQELVERVFALLPGPATPP